MEFAVIKEILGYLAKNLQYYPLFDLQFHIKKEFFLTKFSTKAHPASNSQPYSHIHSNLIYKPQVEYK